jgi:hypothetical protein
MSKRRRRLLVVAFAVLLLMPASGASGAVFTEGIEPGMQRLTALGLDCGSNAGPDCPAVGGTIVDWGDASPGESAVISRVGGCPRDPDTGELSCVVQFSGSHRYAEEGSYTGHVSYSYTDVNGIDESGSVQFTATVSDAPLANGGGRANLVGYQGVRFPLSDAVLATFSDDNPGASSADFAATINWGDGSPTDAGTVRAALGGGFVVHGSHTYGFPGPETITINVSDEGGSTVGPITTTAQVLVQPPFPTTTITLNPANPNGTNGWYRSSIHATLSATDTGATVTETRCALDPANPPPSVDALPAAPCAFGGAGAEIVADGTHVLYGASVNEAGEKEAPVGAVVRIDTTPPRLTCPAVEPTITIGTTGAVLSAAVSDSGSGPVTSTVTAPPDLSSPARKSATFTGFDNAGNTTRIACSYIVKPPSLQPAPTISYAAKPTHKTTTFTSLAVNNVASGERVSATCRGQCPFRAHSVRVVEPRRKVCTGKRCHNKHIRPPDTRDLAGLFHHAHLPAGTRISVSVTKSNTIGKVFLFKILAGHGPRLTSACLAPGSSIPGRGC